MIGYRHNARANLEATFTCVMMVVLLTFVSGCSVVVRKKIEDNGKKKKAEPALCQSNDDCDDGDLCNGTEYCAPEANIKDARGCTFGVMPADGYQCETGNNPQGTEICVQGACVVKKCGDGYVDPTIDARYGPVEECDDANTDDKDGCTADCKFTCKNDENCQALFPSPNACVHASTCDLETHRCRLGMTTVAPNNPSCIILY